MIEEVGGCKYCIYPECAAKWIYIVDRKLFLVHPNYIDEFKKKHQGD